MEIVLTITLDKDGKVDINGPLVNKVLCLGLLEIAKHIVLNFEKKDKIIIPVKELIGN